MPHDIAKGLEIWTLQTLLNVSIMLGFFALGLVIIQPYYQNLKEQLTLRVSIEWLEMLSTVLADFFLAVVVLIGFFVLNPDIMADIKIAVPFVPFATILFAVALVKRLLCGGHDLSKKAGKQAVWLMFWANLLNIVGFSIVMEAPSSEYLRLHPSQFWSFVKSYLRSNAEPHGPELAQWTFYLCFPALLLIFIWGFGKAIKSFSQKKG